MTCENTVYYVYLESFERRWGEKYIKDKLHKNGEHVVKPLKRADTFTLNTMRFLNELPEIVKRACFDGYKFYCEYFSHSDIRVRVESPVANDDIQMRDVITSAFADKTFVWTVSFQILKKWHVKITDLRYLGCVSQNCTLVSDYVPRMYESSMSINLNMSKFKDLRKSVCSRIIRCIRRAISTMFNIKKDEVCVYFEGPYTHVMHEYYPDYLHIRGSVPLGHNISAVHSLIADIFTNFPRNDIDPVTDPSHYVCCLMYDNYHDDNFDDRNVALLLDKCKTIRYVTLSCVDVSEIPKTLEALLQLRTVVCINLAHTTGLTIDYIDALSRLQTLELLDLRGVDPLVVGRALSILGVNKCVYANGYMCIDAKERIAADLLETCDRLENYEEHYRSYAYRYLN